MKNLKKTVSLILFLSIFAMGLSSFANTTSANIKAKKEFEQRLNLSEKQKAKAKAIHQQGREEMKPIIYKLHLDKQELDQVRQSNLQEKAKQEKIDSLNEDIRKLQKQAGDIRKKNSAEFEKILNKQQREELAKMKAEGRARFERNHPPRAPFAGLGIPKILTPQNSSNK